MKRRTLIIGLCLSALVHAMALGAVHVILTLQPARASAVQLTIARGEPIRVTLVEDETLPEVEPVEPVEPAAPIEPTRHTPESAEPEVIEAHSMTCWDVAKAMISAGRSLVAAFEADRSPNPAEHAVVETASGELQRLIEWARELPMRVNRPAPSDRLAGTAPALPSASPPPVETRHVRVPPLEVTPPVPPPSHQTPPPVTSPPTDAPPTRQAQSGVERGAEVLFTPRPSYPARAVARRQQGDVLVLVEVLADGTVGLVELSESSGYDLLDEAALAAAKRCRFKPAMHDGIAIATTALVPFEFHLD